MKKVIEQDFFLYIGDIEVSTDSDGDIEVLQWNKGREGGCDIVTVGKSKAREVALAICPELESELKEAIELIEEMVKETETHYPTLAESGYHKSHEKRKAFLTKHKSKE